MPRDNLIPVRVDSAERQTIEEAAAATGQTVSAFLREAALTCADEVAQREASRNQPRRPIHRDGGYADDPEYVQEAVNHAQAFRASHAAYRFELTERPPFATWDCADCNGRFHRDASPVGRCLWCAIRGGHDVISGGDGRKHVQSNQGE